LELVPKHLGLRQDADPF